MDLAQAVDLIGRAAISAVVLAVFVPAVILGLVLIAHWALDKRHGVER